MGISQSLYTGVTGLSVNSDGMSVIANNIANANAKGFKYDRAEFEDLISVDLGTGNSQMGRGAKLANVKTVHTQGGLQVTDLLTDLAIQGNGFFSISNPNAETQESGGVFFTRVGSFQFDKDGYLSDVNGGHVKGFMADGNGALSSRLSDVRIVTSNLPPVATKTVSLNLNLDSRSKAITEDFDINNPEKTSNWNTTVNVFDSNGAAHATTVYFRKIDDSNGTTWEYHAAVDAQDVTDADEGATLKEVGRGKISFNPEGQLLSETPEYFSANFVGGAFANQNIVMDFGKNIGEEKGNGVGATACTASRADTIFHSQDGFEAGNLKSLKIDADGSIVGFFTNGVQKVLAAVAISTFENQDGLKKAGHNQFYKTRESGPDKTGLPQTGTRGSIFSSALEESNVDFAKQFVDMIMTQRGFQANSRSITTTDTMLEEVINLKR